MVCELVSDFDHILERRFEILLVDDGSRINPGKSPKTACKGQPCQNCSRYQWAGSIPLCYAGSL